MREPTTDDAPDAPLADSSGEPTRDDRAREFTAMFAASDDPWRFRERWYEQRKRALTLACLPHRRYASAYEPGCANGELSAALAPRCDRLLVSDGADAAVALATHRLADQPHARAFRAWLPDDWPAEDFDLIVFSEVGYYLDGSDLDRLLDRMRRSLTPAGVLVACHWRAAIPGCTLTGDAVHARIADRLGLNKCSALVESDFRLEVWCRDGHSVAQREGFA